MTPVWWQRAESAFVVALVMTGAVYLGFAWWWLVALFLAFDLSALGYLVGNRVGAFAYNTVHNYAVPAVLFTVYLLIDVRWLALLALAWAFHVAVDRALGYGLKHDDSFAHTHLGWLRGKRADASQGVD
jgi:hypothetical protein